MSDPIVTLPANHWIVREYEAWLKFKGFYATHPSWEAFAAGAQAIPGNPEKIAELERKLRESQTEYQIEILDRNLQEANEHIVMLIKGSEASQREITRLADQLKVVVSRLDIAEKTLAEGVEDVGRNATINYERWNSLEAHVERIREGSNSKYETTMNGLAAIEEKLIEIATAFEKKTAAKTEDPPPLIFSDTASRAHSFADHLGLEVGKWIHVRSPVFVRGIERTRVFYVDWPLEDPEVKAAYEEWRK